MKNLNLSLILFSALIIFAGCNSSKNISDSSSGAVTSPEAAKSQNKSPDNTPETNTNEKFRQPGTNSFTLIAIPDTQGYVDFFAQTEHKKSFPCNQYLMNNRQMAFIAQNSVKNGGDFACAIHLGDFVNEGSWFKYEWKKADEALSYLDGQIPLISVIGNHDYDNHYKMVAGRADWLKGSKMFNKYFGANSKYYKDKEWYGGSTENGLNNWIIFEGAGRKFLVIGFEVEPSAATLAWAQSVIDSHPDLPVIVATHSYIDVSDDESGQGRFLGRHYREDGLAPKEIHENFILKNKNIFMVLCAHASSGDNCENSRIDTNEAGYPVYTLLSDFQSRNHIIEDRYPEYKGKKRWCGDGWLRLMNFDFNSKQIHVETWSTEYEKFETDEDSDFYLPISWDWEERFSK